MTAITATANTKSFVSLLIRVAELLPEIVDAWSRRRPGAPPDYTDDVVESEIGSAVHGRLQSVGQSCDLRSPIDNAS